MDDLLLIKTGAKTAIDADEYAVFGSKEIAYKNERGAKVVEGGRFPYVFIPSATFLKLDYFDQVVSKSQTSKATTDQGVFIIETSGFYSIQYSLTIAMSKPVDDLQVHIDSANFGPLISSKVLPLPRHSFSIGIPEVYLDAGDEIRLAATRTDTMKFLDFTIEEPYFLLKKLK